MNSKADEKKANPPLVSICIPTYNDAACLSEMLRSIVSQTYYNLEIEVGDDASTDETHEIVKSFVDSRIRYHRNEQNLGQFPNVNSILGRARGKYVAIFHSDDLYEPDIVAKEVEFLEAHPELGAVFAMDYRITYDGKLIGITKLPACVPSRVPLELADLMPPLLRLKNTIVRTPTFMGRPEVFEAVGYFSDEFDIAGDFEMWLRIMTRYPIAILDEPLLHYRHADNQVSARYNHLRTFEEHYFTIMDTYLRFPDGRTNIDDDTLAEFEFHRTDDKTTRAANFVILGKPKLAIALINSPFPWRTLRVKLTRRKLRVVLLRYVLKIGLGVGAAKLLGRILTKIEN